MEWIVLREALLCCVVLPSYGSVLLMGNLGSENLDSGVCPEVRAGSLTYRELPDADLAGVSTRQ